MNKKRTILGGAILVAVLMLGIGYALISNVPLSITGNATADANAENFKVEFDTAAEKTTTSSQANVTASVTDADEATLSVQGLTAKGDSEYAIFTINNKSEDLSAVLSVTTSEITEADDAGYFSINTEIVEPKTLTAGGTTTVKVTVTLEKTPIDGVQTGTINVKLNAKPEQP